MANKQVKASFDELEKNMLLYVSEEKFTLKYNMHQEKQRKNGRPSYAKASEGRRES